MADTGTTTVRASGDLCTVLDLIQTVSSTTDIRDAFSRVMQILAAEHKVQRGCLVLLDDATGRASAAAAFGMTADEVDKGRYLAGEGVIGSVIATGRARIIRDIRDETDFLNRTGRYSPATLQSAMSFLCVPLRVDGRFVGAIWADKFFVDDEQLRRDHALLEVLGSVFSQCIRVDRMVLRDKQELLAAVQQIRSHAREKYRFESVIGDAPAMQEVFATVGQVANSRATVLLLGETGTGKEMIAKAIHFNSPRRNNAFVRVNCGALTGTLLESELFGHIKGSFTGAIRDKIGRFEAADGGTIFLDEIGTLEPELQVKLLRVLQEKEFMRVGGTRPIRTDVRILAATARDLREEVRQGRFRDDLYYRIGVVPVPLPPLRERTADIRLLARHFLGELKVGMKVAAEGFEPDAMAAMQAYKWPGNVRELRNVVEHMLVLHGHHSLIPVEALPPEIRGGLRKPDGGAPAPGLPLKESIEAQERRMIADALDRAGGVQTRAAKLLGTTRRILGYRMAKLGIAGRAPPRPSAKHGRPGEVAGWSLGGLAPEDRAEVPPWPGRRGRLQNPPGIRVDSGAPRHS